MDEEYREFACASRRRLISAMRAEIHEAARRGLDDCTFYDQLSASIERMEVAMESDPLYPEDVLGC